MKVAYYMQQVHSAHGAWRSRAEYTLTARRLCKYGNKFSNFRKYAHPLHVKEGIITEKVFPVFSESFFWTYFGLVMYIWELMGVTEKFAFQM